MIKFVGGQTDIMLFNIYYLNFTKVYEIKMMLSNVIKTDQSVEVGNNDNIDAELQAKMGTKFLKLFNGEIGSDIKTGSTDSQKVLENFKVTMTKSLILNEVLEKCKIVNDFRDLTEGQLVRIDNVSLSLENETELRTVKCFLMVLLKVCIYQKPVDLTSTMCSIRFLKIILIN